MSYLARLREAEKNSKRPPPPSVESIENALNPIFDTLDTPSPGPFADSDGREARRLWLVRHQDGSLWSHSYTPPASLEEVLCLHPAALVIEPEPEEDHQDGESPPLAFSGWHTDDRITCRQCRQHTGARCLAAARGEFAQASREHVPDPERLRRCYHFQPLANDADQTPGAMRWPDLRWMLRGNNS